MTDNFDFVMQVCSLDEMGYHLVEYQRDLTTVQKLFLFYALKPYNAEKKRIMDQDNPDPYNKPSKRVVDTNWRKRQELKRGDKNKRRK